LGSLPLPLGALVAQRKHSVPIKVESERPHAKRKAEGSTPSEGAKLISRQVETLPYSIAPVQPSLRPHSVAVW